MGDNQEQIPTNRAQLLQTVGNAHDELERTLALLRNEQMTEALLEGGWSVKDLMSHLTAWEQLTLQRLAVRRDAEKLAEIYSRFGEGDEGLNRLNNDFYEESKDKPLPDVRRDFNLSYSKFMQAVGDLPEEELFEEGHSLIWDGAPLLGLIAGNSYAHYREHAAQVQAIVDRGNQPDEEPLEENTGNAAPADKEQLLTIIEEAHNKLLRAIEGFTPEQMTEPALDGGRSVKDVLAHVTAWERLLLSVLPQVNSGRKELPTGGDDNFEGTDSFNKKVFAKNKDRPYADVASDFASTYAELLDFINATPEDRLLGPASPTWWGQEPTWQFIAENTYRHYTEHAEQIEQANLQG